MKIYNKEKTIILEEYDLDTGYLKEDILATVIPAIEGIEEEGHWETIKEYGNGGKDVEWVVDKAGVTAQEERIETENISVYIPYTQEELAEQQKAKQLEIENKRLEAKNKQIEALKKQLTDTDYQIIKTYEYSLVGKELPYDIAELNSTRDSYREQINALETDEPFAQETNIKD